MIHFKNIVICILFLAIFSVRESFSKNSAMPKKVLVLTDSQYKGDENQVLGIMDALSEDKSSRLSFKIGSYSDYRNLKYFPEGQEILMVSGVSGLLFIKNMNPDLRSKLQIIWSGHQVFDQLEDVSSFIKLIFLPEHAVSKSDEQILLKNSKIMLLNGVPNRISKSSLLAAKKEFEQKNGPLPSGSVSQIIAVVLPGDAPDKSGKINFFTPKDSQKLADNIVKLEGTTKHYIVTNGPRTGSFNYQNSKKLDPSPHRMNVVDRVTSAFIRQLKKNGVKQISLYDFQFNNLPSVYQSVLSLATTGMRVHIPGESTSMVTESTQFSRNIVIDIVSSMNSDHHQHLESVRNNGVASILSLDGKLWQPKQSAKDRNDITPAESAAKAILRSLSQ